MLVSNMFSSLFNPSEMTSMLEIKYGPYIKQLPVNQTIHHLEHAAETLNDRDFCYLMLASISETFYLSINQLPNQLKDPVCVFYLVLRALDSVEDDMTIDQASKQPLLRSFYQKLHTDWSTDCLSDGSVGEKDEYRCLLKHFDKVLNVFRSINPTYQSIITIITRKMGAGMAEFADQPEEQELKESNVHSTNHSTRQSSGRSSPHQSTKQSNNQTIDQPFTRSIDTLAQYNLYCHYVAGLVGDGLSQMFSASGLEDRDLGLQSRLSNSMGIFLQKTNMIRDYSDELSCGRTPKCPKQIWAVFGGSLDSFSDCPNAPESLCFLNAMVTDALSHVPDCLDYLMRLNNPSIFEFCAIPQTLALATLLQVYNNEKVFTKGIKVRKNIAAKMMLESSNMIQVKAWFREFTDEFLIKLKEAQKYTKMLEDKEAIKKQSINQSINQSTADSDDSDSLSSRLSRLNLGPDRTRDLLNQIRHLAAPGTQAPSALTYVNFFAWLVFLAATAYLFSRLRGGGDADQVGHPFREGNTFNTRGPGFGLMASGLDVLAVLVCFVSVGYLFGFFGISYI